VPSTARTFFARPPADGHGVSHLAAKKPKTSRGEPSLPSWSLRVSSSHQPLVADRRNISLSLPHVSHLEVHMAHAMQGVCGAWKYTWPTGLSFTRRTWKCKRDAGCVRCSVMLCYVLDFRAQWGAVDQQAWRSRGTRRWCTDCAFCMREPSSLLQESASTLTYRHAPFSPSFPPSFPPPC
jgi:hypothetical protein